jgi:DNA invertase Pin-like site-specific DNA recombinase
MRAALYARVSTIDQNCENQLRELRAYCQARGFQVSREFIDHGVSGSRDRRPALDELVTDAKRRRFDVLICWRLDRLGRSLRHLVTFLADLQAIGIGFVSLNEGIDMSTAAGRLQLHILAALAEFERSRMQERVRAGLARAQADGQRLGRPVVTIPRERLQAVSGLSLREAAERLGVSRSTVQRWRAELQVSHKTPLNED